MEQQTPQTLIEHFSAITDPRIERCKRHKLIDILLIAICASICGADGWEEIELFGQAKMDNQLTSPKFLTVEEVAELLRVSPRSVYDWVSQSVIPFHKAGRRTIFLLDEILEWSKPEGQTRL